MKTRPILFSAPMVRALLDGSKTQTRRVLKQAVGPSLSVDCEDGIAELSWLYGDLAGHEVNERIKRIDCQYGKPGDHLWVRETFYAFGRWETRFSTKKCHDEWHFVDMTVEKNSPYQFDTELISGDIGGKHNSDITPRWWKRPAIFMPRAFSRITLEITDVRVERLQDISESDAIAEGIEKWSHSERHGTKWNCPPHIRRFGTGDNVEDVSYDGFPVKDPREAYRGLWESINGPGSWDANPLVWVIEFKRIAEDGNAGRLLDGFTHDGYPEGS